MNNDELLATMTLEEKIGQMFLLAFAGTRLDEARVLFEEHFVGAAYLGDDNLPDAATAASLTNTLQSYAANTRLQIPLLLGADQEGAWSVMTREQKGRERSAMGPGNLALGAANDPALTRAMYRTIADELGVVGLNAIFAPCADVNSNPYNAIIGMRSFGAFPDRVAAQTVAAVEGALSGGIIPTLKHFPGHGDTQMDSHRGLPTVERTADELRAIDLKPFADGIAAGAPIVMTSHIIFPAFDAENPATLSRRILIDLLRGEMGFDGVILSDSMNMGAIKKVFDSADAAIRAFNAGVDLLMLAEEHYDHSPEQYLASQQALIGAVIAAAQDGRLPMARVDDAVRRVLNLKMRHLARRSLVAHEIMARALVGSPPNRAVELDAARAAVALLRDQDGALPLPKDRVYIVVNTTQRAAYAVLGKTRGIGPNQTTSAFDTFYSALSETHPQARIYEATDAALDGDLSAWRDLPVIAVTENYALPGMDFDQSTQAATIQKLLKAGIHPIVVALRDPYELANAAFDGVGTYICAFSFRPSAARAAAEVVAGVITARGVSPV
ncbi:MAG: glycoside hydrolase family 3 N-terminal domain-containing protein [Chloroflexota bacterium]|nr:glycoside hydrolase family 3 N-terminal domain-containing protein [Chloroflexota bacterium]